MWGQGSCRCFETSACGSSVCTHAVASQGKALIVAPARWDVCLHAHSLHLAIWWPSGERWSKTLESANSIVCVWMRA